MGWFQLHCDCHAHQVPELEALHTAQGALAITLQDQADDAIFEPEVGQTPVWPNATLTALYPSDYSVEDTLNQLLIDSPLSSIHNYRVEWLEEKPWEREWLKHFKPFLVADSLQIMPSHYVHSTDDSVHLNQHETGEPKPLTTIILDPGLAFGTGNHATTQLCLRWLSQELAISPATSCLDYGCGSGILGIAAALLGVDQVTAVDIDPQALLATRYNAEKNQVRHIVDIQAANTLETPCQFELIVANILAEPLIQLSQHLTTFLKPGGKIALSGLLASQLNEVIDAYSPFISLQIAEVQDDWGLLVGTL